MTYKLFIDDERNPIDDTFVVVRNSAAAIIMVTAAGMPREIAFDHDLGGDDTAMEFVKWLEEQLLDGVYRFPPDFRFSVHSQNPVGASNIRERMKALIDNFSD